MAEINMRVDVALAEVPVNIMPLLDDADFKTIDTTIVYNSAGMDLRWNFVTANGATTSTAVTPTTSGDYDWTHQGDGMYTIEVPASGGASINNDTEGCGWFTGVVTGVLPFRGPIIQFIPDALADIEDGSASIGTAQTGDSYAIVNSGSFGNAAIKTETAAILVDTTAIEIDTQDIQSRIPAALVTGRIDASVGAMAADVVTAASIANGAIDANTFAAGAVDAAALATDAVTEIVTAVFGRAFSAAYGSYTFDEMVKLMSSALLAKCSGMNTTTATFRNLADSANTIVATVDADGNRTAITRTP